MARTQIVMSPASKASILKDLRSDILRLQGFSQAANASLDMSLGPIRDALPCASFPLGAVHEFLSPKTESSSPTSGFIAGLLSSLMGSHGTTLWISSARTLFPPALKVFGLEPDRFIFVDLQKERDVLQAMDEALKCKALSAVVGELRDIDFKTSRRFQLAVEQSQVTGFIIRNNCQNLNTTACISRWRITSLPSESDGGMPGVGFPKWRVELLRMRNGKSGTWNTQWINGRFVATEASDSFSADKSVNEKRKAG
jgi:protein ImuA